MKNGKRNRPPGRIPWLRKQLASFFGAMLIAIPVVAAMAWTKVFLILVGLGLLAWISITQIGPRLREGERELLHAAGALGLLVAGCVLLTAPLLFFLWWNTAPAEPTAPDMIAITVQRHTVWLTPWQHFLSPAGLWPWAGLLAALAAIAWHTADARPRRRSTKPLPRTSASGPSISA